MRLSDQLQTRVSEQPLDGFLKDCLRGYEIRWFRNTVVDLNFIAEEIPDSLEKSELSTLSYSSACLSDGPSGTLSWLAFNRLIFDFACYLTTPALEAL